MRKNDLIKKLQDIEGNPEVMLYNGFVDDWHHIFIKESVLESVKPEIIEQCVRSQNNNSEKSLKFKAKNKWEFDLSSIWKQEELNQKRVVLIFGKRRGKKNFNRYLNVEY